MKTFYEWAQNQFYSTGWQRKGESFLCKRKGSPLPFERIDLWHAWPIENNMIAFRNNNGRASAGSTTRLTSEEFDELFDKVPPDAYDKNGNLRIENIPGRA